MLRGKREKGDELIHLDHKSNIFTDILVSLGRIVSCKDQLSRKYQINIVIFKGTLLSK